MTGVNSLMLPETQIKILNWMQNKISLVLEHLLNWNARFELNQAFFLPTCVSSCSRSSITILWALQYIGRKVQGVTQDFMCVEPC